MDKNLYLIELSASLRTDFGQRDFAEQSHEQKVFSSVWELESEVCSGGFQHYFINCAEESAEFAPAALDAIGAQQCAAIVEHALALVPSLLPPDKEGRREALYALPAAVAQQFHALDDRFVAYPDNLTDLLFAFVAAHPEVFGAVPEVG